MVKARVIATLGTLGACAVIAAVGGASVASAASTAPGTPGSMSYFDLARKDCVGTARNTTSKVWFTVADGVLSDTYWPTIDATNVNTLQYLVTDGHSFTDLQTRDMSYKVLPDPTGMACTVSPPAAPTTTGSSPPTSPTPSSDSVLMHSSFEGPRSDQLYVRLDPLAGGTGGGADQNASASNPENAGGNSAELVDVGRGQTVPVDDNTNTVTNAVNRTYAVPTYMALESSSGFSSESVGYAGTASDGLTMLDSAHALTPYSQAPDGHVTLTAEIPSPLVHAGARVRHQPGCRAVDGECLGGAELRPGLGGLRGGLAPLRRRAAQARPLAGPGRDPRVLRVGQRGQGQRGQDLPRRDRRRPGLAVGPVGTRRHCSPTASRRTSAPTARSSRATRTRRSPGCWSPATSGPPRPPRTSCSTASNCPTARCRATRCPTARRRPTPAASSSTRPPIRS